jgi:hypothetical protein
MPTAREEAAALMEHLRQQKLHTALTEARGGAARGCAQRSVSQRAALTEAQITRALTLRCAGALAPHAGAADALRDGHAPPL